MGLAVFFFVGMVCEMTRANFKWRDEFETKKFRGYLEVVKFSVRNLNTLLGRNDAGKPTLLEALEIFFNNKLVYCEREDLSV